MVRLLTTKEVAAQMRLSVKEVQRRARSGEIPGHKDGRRTMFLESEIDRFLQRLPAAND